MSGVSHKIHLSYHRDSVYRVPLGLVGTITGKTTPAVVRDEGTQRRMRPEIKT